MPSVATPNLPPIYSPEAGVPDDLIWKISVERYHEMIRSGVLTPDDPVELLDGFLVYKMPKNRPHIVASQLTREALAKLVTAGWHVASQDPVTTDTSEPEPDATVVRGQIRDYTERHPGPKDTALLVEVADSSLRRDQGWKKQIYARAGLPVYWIINLVDRRLEVHSDPTGPSEKPAYRQCSIFMPDQEVPVILDGKEVGRILVKDILP